MKQLHSLRLELKPIRIGTIKYIILPVLFLTCFTCHSQEYKKLHRNAIVIDTHNDLLYAVIMKGMHLEDDLTGKAHSDFTRFKKGGVDAQVFAVFCDESFGKDTAFKFANIEIDSLYAIAARNADKMTMVRTPSDLMHTVKHKKLAGMIGVEGGHMIEDNLSYLDSLFARGALYLTLTWNNSTSWATSSWDESRDSIKNEKKGLNDFGIKVVRRMNDLGMIVDVSHIGEQTFWDVIANTSKPVIASHSSVYSICPVHRNLKDEQIKAIAKNGGVIQLNFNSGFLDSTYNKQIKSIWLSHRTEIDSLRNQNWKNSAIDDFISLKYKVQIDLLAPPLAVALNHIDHIVKLVGIDYVGLGSDFDGIHSPPNDLTDVSYFPGVTKGLLERGYTKKAIKKILGGNFMRVFKANAR